MKRFFRRSTMVVLAFASLSLNAQVTNFSVFKVTVYQQTGGTPPSTPDTPNAYYFGAQLNTSDSTGYLDVNLTGPGAAPTAYLSEITPYYFDFGSPYYADKPGLDADYPSGEYDFYVDYTNFSEFGSVTVPAQELYATNVAAFTTNCWNAMQQVDPAQDFTLNWNSFVASPGTTSAYTFIDIFNENTGEAPFSADFLTPDTITTNIPANTLQYGEVYRVNAFFSNRQDTSDAGFGGALGTVGFDNLTYTTLITIPPWLKISAANTNITLTWPVLSTNYVLESAVQLSAGAVWSTITNVPTPVGYTNVLTLPAAAPGRFFRLISTNSL